MTVMIGLIIIGFASASQQTENHIKQAKVELDTLKGKVKNFTIIDLTDSQGDVTLDIDQSLTIDDLRGIKLDDGPPELGGMSAKYDPSQTDDYPPKQAPYVARDIAPFRFRYFNCEFNYGGWHNLAMMDYAVTHGFNILYPYVRKQEEMKNLPEGSGLLRWGGFVDWHKWLREHNIPDSRYDMLIGMNLMDEISESGVFKAGHISDYLMIDMEHGCLGADQLRKQEWYPKDLTGNEQSKFEEKYYDGYALTYIAPIRSARLAGWKNISLYGWEPFARRWYGLESINLDPETDWAWNAFGKKIYSEVDILNPSVYCFYWSQKNVAYTLANIDLNMKLAKSMPELKPMRPYYWTLMHGGGDGYRWWRELPLANEEVRAMIALGFFTGFDGFVTWNWSGTGNHHVPADLRKKDKDGKWVYSDVMVKDEFMCKAEDEQFPLRLFNRYDVLHIVDIDSETDMVRFQLVDKAHPDKNENVPVYIMAKNELAGHLRPKSEPVSAMIEGMALVKPFEYILRYGETKIDVSVQEQFGKSLPIIRRVRLGDTHIIATYDPVCVYGGKPRQIVLRNFDGKYGLTLRIPADSQTRIFVIRQQDSRENQSKY